MFETSESQGLTRDSHIINTGRTEWGKALAKNNKVPKGRGQALASLRCYVLVPTFGTIEELSDEESHTSSNQLSKKTTPPHAAQVPVWGEPAVSPACVLSPSSPSSAPGDSSLQPLLWHLKCSSGSQWLLKRSQVYSMSTYTFLPWDFTKRQDSPALGSSHPLIPGRANERVGGDGLQGVMVLRWEDHTRLLENGTFLHLVIQTSLRSKVLRLETDLS